VPNDLLSPPPPFFGVARNLKRALATFYGRFLRFSPPRLSPGAPVAYVPFLPQKTIRVPCHFRQYPFSHDCRCKGRLVFSPLFSPLEREYKAVRPGISFFLFQRRSWKFLTNLFFFFFLPPAGPSRGEIADRTLRHLQKFLLPSFQEMARAGAGRVIPSPFLSSAKFSL